MPAIVRRRRAGLPAGFEPGARRLAPVARGETGRHVGRAGSLERVAVRRTEPGGKPAERARATRRSRRRTATLHARRARGTEYVIAFDAETGKRLWRWSTVSASATIAATAREGRRRWTATGCTAFGASGDMSAMEAATARSVWRVNVLNAVRRIEHQVGAERVAAGPERPDPHQRRRAGRLDRRVEEDRRIADLEERADEAGYSSASCSRLAAYGRQCLHRRACARRRRETGHLLWSYDKAANGTANIATPIVRGNRVFLSSGYGTGAALLELTPGNGTVSAREVYFHARHAQPPPSSVLVGDHVYGFSDAILTQCTSIPARGLARSQRRQGLDGVRRRSALSLQRGGRGRARRGKPCGYREHGRFRSAPAVFRRGAIQSSPAASSSSGPGHGLCVRYRAK